MMDVLEQALSRIPDVVWAAVGASALTLVGVWLQNRWETERAKQGLSHDAAERRLEREMTLRRDIYLEAAEAATAAQGFLAQVVNTNIPAGQVSANPGSLSGLAKTHIVASLATVKAFQVLGGVFLDELLALFEARAEYEAARINSEEAAERVAQLRKYQEQYMAGVREIATRVQLTNAQMENALQHLSAKEPEIHAAEEERAKATRALQEKQRTMVVRGVEAQLNYQKALASANLAVRAELELASDLDSERYLELSEQAGEAAHEKFEAFLARLVKRFGDETG